MLFTQMNPHNYLIKQPTRNPQAIKDSQLRWQQTLRSFIWNGCTYTQTHGPYPCHFKNRLNGSMYSNPYSEL